MKLKKRLAKEIRNRDQLSEKDASFKAMVEDEDETNHFES